ncbi:MAG: FAD-dependent oxidoreductase [Bacteroidota bacterium]|nr:FAD-dependent oxidoreductase [Bacteroidota bacterium]
MVSPSIWEKESFYAPADIVIAGSGFVGLWCAYFLRRAEPGRSVMIVDRGVIPTGASTRNAGFACFGSLTELIADSRQMGEGRMLELVEMRYRGLKRIRKTFSGKEIGYKSYGGFELIAGSDPMDMNAVRSSIDWLNRQLKKITKEQKTFRLQDDKIAGFGFAGISHLIENRTEGQLHPGKLCLALLRLVQSMGVTVLSNTEVLRYERTPDKLLLHTNHAFTLSANKLLICTNAFARQLLPQLDVEPARGQVLVTSPIAKLPFKGTFHYDQGFYYFRDLGDRVLLGGARNKAPEAEHTDEMVVTGQIQAELERMLRDVILPGRDYAIEHRWSGIMGMGKEKQPILQQVEEGIYCAVRMSGMGVALAPVMGERAAAMME